MTSCQETKTTTETSLRLLLVSYYSTVDTRLQCSTKLDLGLRHFQFDLRFTIHCNSLGPRHSRYLTQQVGSVVDSLPTPRSTYCFLVEPQRVVFWELSTHNSFSERNRLLNRFFLQLFLVILFTMILFRMGC